MHKGNQEYKLDTLKVQRLSEGATLPTRTHPNDAGMDLYSLEEFTLSPGQGHTTRTGIAIALPDGYVALVADRSSYAKRGIKTAGGVVDAGYRGEIHIVLWNISGEVQSIKKGDRIAQVLILPIATPAIAEVSELPSSERGAKGFGSSGR